MSTLYNAPAHIQLIHDRESGRFGFRNLRTALQRVYDRSHINNIGALIDAIEQSTSISPAEADALRALYLPI